MGKEKRETSIDSTRFRILANGSSQLARRRRERARDPRPQAPQGVKLEGTVGVSEDVEALAEWSRN